MIELLLLAQQVGFDVAKPFEHCLQIGAALQAYGDWDHDGHNDFLISAPTSIFESVPTVALVSGKDGRGLLVLRDDRTIPNRSFGATLTVCADVDGDARPEIAASADRRTRVFSSKDGHALYELNGWAPSALTDVDGDGHRDWIVPVWFQGTPAKI